MSYNFFYSPDDKERIASDHKNIEDEILKHAEKSEKPGFFEKIKQALQDWSNDNAADTEYDDEHV